MEYKKKYKEALELMKDCIPDKDGLVHIRPCEIFPELKKSEDERIRKELKSFFDSEMSDYGNVEWRKGIRYGEIVAWLEKQDKKDSQVILPTFTFDDILALQCCMKKVQKDEELYNQLQILHDRLHDAYWLEKQGEQKPAYKVEPKFKVGDWINKDGAIWRIEGVNGKEYILGGRPDVVIQEPIHIIDSEFRLWTIQDAKDGDIIVNDFVGGTCVAIYKSFTNDGTNIYCHLVNNDFCPKHGNSNAKWHPSTKEQRDLLFQKMEEAGYEWNDEKKELKMAESVQPELPNGEDYGIDSLYHAERILEKTLGEVEGYQSDDGILEHKCAIEAVKRLYKQKPTWSEEDDARYYGVIETEQYVLDVVNGRREFSVGNEQIRKECIKELDWLKSLKERYTWRPSDEQMEALYTYIYNPQYFNSPDQRMELVESVYKDLKKLKEE